MKTKAYFEINGVKYYDYDIFIDFYTRKKVPDYCVNSTVFDTLISSTLLDKTISPAEGSDIYVATDCSIPIEDLRAHYNIKRKEDTGDVNVFELRSSLKTRVYAEGLIIFPSQKCIFADVQRHTESEMLEIAAKIFPNAITSEAVVIRQYVTVIWPDDSKGNYPLLLKGSLSKPCIPLSALKITGNNKLTLDALWLAYLAADFNSDLKRNMSNFLIQLNVINQCNWADFPGTMAVWNEVIQYKTPINRINRYRSKFPKIVHRLIPQPAARVQFSSSEDKKLAQSFVAKLLDLPENPVFVSMFKLEAILCKHDLTLTTFNRLYDTTVRIRRQNEEV